MVYPQAPPFLNEAIRYYLREFSCCVFIPFSRKPVAGPQLLVLSSPVSGGACVNSQASHEGIGVADVEKKPSLPPGPDTFLSGRVAPEGQTGPCRLPLVPCLGSAHVIPGSVAKEGSDLNPK